MTSESAKPNGTGPNTPSPAAPDARTAFRVLLVEDNPGDADLILAMLEDSRSTRFEFERATHLAAATARLATGGIDLVLLDLGLPDSVGLDTLTAVRAAAPGTPVVVLTGNSDESTAVQAVRSGAADYLVKGMADARGLARTLRYAIERSRTEANLQLAAEVLGILNRPNDRKALIADILGLVKAHTGMSAVGIRLRDGDVYPYFVQNGFGAEFVRLENQLACVQDGAVQRDAAGRPVLECTCGLVLAGRPPPDNPLFTACGSFWCNDTTPLLELPAELDPRHQPRNRCIHEGYQSVALIPLRSAGEIIGLLQLNDRRTDRFTAEMIQFFEGLGNSIGIAMARLTAEEALRTSETFANSLIDTAQAVVLVLDPQGRIVQFNPYFGELSGYRLEEVKGKDWFGTFLPERIRESTRELFLAAISGIQTRGNVNPILTKDGRERLVEWYDKTLRDADGTVVGLLSTGQDVTERKQAEEAVAQARRDWEEAFDAINDAITIHDTDFNILRANKAAARLLGVPVDELTGRKCYRVYHACECPPDGCPSCPTARTGRPAAFELYEPALGRHLALRSFARQDEDGNVIGVVHVARDVTEQRALEAQLRQTQKLESIGTLAAGVAHEINNPINGIMNYAQLIKDELAGSNATLGEFAGEIIHETERIATLTRNLLQFARQEKKSHSPARIADIVESTLSLIRTVIRHDQITLEVDVPEDLPEIKCRSQQIQQVLMNLLTNARDALNEKYPGYDEDKIIIVTAREMAMSSVSDHQLLGKQEKTAPNDAPQGLTDDANRVRAIRLTVEDHGPGIPDEVRERMFDPFYTTKGRHEGTGLGLSITHGIISDHHGTVQVDSTPGEGTTFRIDLPVDSGWELEAADEE